MKVRTTGPIDAVTHQPVKVSSLHSPCEVCGVVRCGVRRGVVCGEVWCVVMVCGEVWCVLRCGVW